jgi:hypothetical protein
LRSFGVPTRMGCTVWGVLIAVEVALGAGVAAGFDRAATALARQFAYLTFIRRKDGAASIISVRR